MKNIIKVAATLILASSLTSCSSGKNKIGCPSFTKVKSCDDKETDFAMATYVVYRSESVTEAARLSHP